MRGGRTKGRAFPGPCFLIASPISSLIGLSHRLPPPEVLLDVEVLIVHSVIVKLGKADLHGRESAWGRSQACMHACMHACMRASMEARSCVRGPRKLKGDAMCAREEEFRSSLGRKEGRNNRNLLPTARAWQMRAWQMRLHLRERERHSPLGRSRWLCGAAPWPGSHFPHPG